MVCSQTCTSADGSISYQFYEDLPLTHQDARRSCSVKNATLATNFTLNDYLAIDSCCKTPRLYRTGLVKSPGKCGEPELYSWFTSAACVDGSPLQIKGKTPAVCQSVAIPVGSLLRNNLSVALRNCSERLPYVCQTRIASTLQNETFSKATDLPFPDNSAATITGIIAACLLVLLLVLLIMLCYFKKRSTATLGLNTLDNKQVCCYTHKRNNEPKKDKKVYDW